MSLQILFFFSAIGTFNAFLLSTYLLVLRKSRAVHEYLLGILVLLFCVRVGVSCYNYFDNGTSWWIIQLGLYAQLLIGPILYWHTATLICMRVSVSTVRLACGLYLFILIIGLIFPFHSYPALWDYNVRYLIHLHLSLYFIWTGYLLRRSYIHRSSSNAEILKIRKAIFVYSFAGLVCIGFVISLYTNYVLGPVIASGLFYVMVFLFTSKDKYYKSSMTGNLSSKNIESAELNRIVTQLKSKMNYDKRYTDPKIKLSDVASELNITAHQLSHILNTYMDKSFSTFVNELRVEEAKELLLSMDHLTIEGIGYESGFSSKSSFFATFKKHTGQTPFQYKSTAKKNSTM